MCRPPTRLWFGSAIAISALALLLIACKPSIADDAGRLADPEATASATSTAPTRHVASVTSVIDGETIEVELGGEARRVRLLMIDAPDPAANDCFSTAATALLFAVAPPGTTLLLERDTSDADSTGNLLRYAYLPDGSMLNEQLLRGGFARFAPVEPDTKYLERLRAAEEEARDRSAGVWAECGDGDEMHTPDANALPITATPTLTPIPAPTQEPARPSPDPSSTPTPAPTPTPTSTPAATPTPSPTASPTATLAPTPRPTTTADPRAGCDPSYPTVCIPPPPPDLDCGDIPYRRFQVIGSDPHRFDGDKDGIGCES